MTTWNSTIPNVNNVPANDAQSMQQNFAVLDSAFQVDHTALSLATNQGMHKQITFAQPPASLPFVPVALQSYEYEKTMAPIAPADPTLSYLEYQSCGPNPNNIVPLSMKAWGILQVTGPGMTVNAGFNINLGTSTRTGSNFIINFITNMPSANFMVFYGVFATNNFNIDKCTAKTVSSITLTAVGTITPGQQVFFAVF